MRKTLPSIGALGFSNTNAEKDLCCLGWYSNDPDTVVDAPEQAAEILWHLSGTADPDLALNTIIRLMEAWGNKKGNCTMHFALTPSYA